jgi:hypothetical protein
MCDVDDCKRLRASRCVSFQGNEQIWQSMVCHQALGVMSLNTELGWSAGDDVRVLVAAQLGVGLYQLNRIQRDMNYLGENAPQVVSPIIDLLDQYDSAQAKFAELNDSSEGKVLTKVDVLEWEVTGGAGSGYSPERELARIRGLLYQYFASSSLFAGGHHGMTLLIRS